MRYKKLVKYGLVFLSFLLVFGSLAYGDANVVVTLAKDLNDQQRREILELFKVEEGQVPLLEINNKEERKYLEGIAPEAQIGNITISSAYVELLEPGSGIEVSTYNISWVSKEMYQGALVTAGIKDAKIIAAAPYPVSGTGALTGIIKAFEKAAGLSISDEQKRVASEEIIQAGELGEDIGKDKASQLINQIKEEILKSGIKTPEDIKKVIVDISGKLDVRLDQEQIDKLSGLMEKIGNLNLNTEDIKNQLKGIGEKLDETLRNNEEVKSLLGKILDAIKDFFRSIFSKR